MHADHQHCTTISPSNSLIFQPYVVQGLERPSFFQGLAQPSLCPRVFLFLILAAKVWTGKHLSWSQACSNLPLVPYFETLSRSKVRRKLRPATSLPCSVLPQCRPCPEALSCGGLVSRPCVSPSTAFCEHGTAALRASPQGPALAFTCL